MQVSDRKSICPQVGDAKGRRPCRRRRAIPSNRSRASGCNRSTCRSSAIATPHSAIKWSLPFSWTGDGPKFLLQGIPSLELTLKRPFFPFRWPISQQVAETRTASPALEQTANTDPRTLVDLGMDKSLPTVKPIGDLEGGQFDAGTFLEHLFFLTWREHDCQDTALREHMYLRCGRQ